MFWCSEFVRSFDCFRGEPHIRMYNLRRFARFFPSFLLLLRRRHHHRFINLQITHIATRTEKKCLFAAALAMAGSWKNYFFFNFFFIYCEINFQIFLFTVFFSLLYFFLLLHIFRVKLIKTHNMFYVISTRVLEKKKAEIRKHTQLLPRPPENDWTNAHHSLLMWWPKN